MTKLMTSLDVLDKLVDLLLPIVTESEPPTGNGGPTPSAVTFLSIGPSGLGGPYQRGESWL